MIKTKINHRKRWLIGCAALLICSAAFLHSPILFSVGDYMIVQDDIKAADVIHVIAGDDHRVDYAIQLYLQGYGKHLFFTGDRCGQKKMVHAEYNLYRAMAKGVPALNITIDGGHINSTYSEIVKLNHFITSSSGFIQSVIIVSDQFHMRRVRWTGRRILGMEIDLIMAPVPFDQSPYQRNWWADSESMLFLLNEYRKNVFYRFRYQWTSGRIRKWLAHFDRY
jgi:uncharacterized SAM-binding protein YcdF (DUF218 family)